MLRYRACIIANSFFQTCLDLWSSSEDKVRIAAFLSVRKLASSTDTSLLDMALKVNSLSYSFICVT